MKMADEQYSSAPRKWSLEEIDELLRDSGIVNGDDETEREAEEPIQKKAESVDPRPTYNENAEHKIKTKNVEKSDADGKTRVFGTLESEKYRERFLKRPSQGFEKTTERPIISENGEAVREGVGDDVFVVELESEKKPFEQEPADGNTRTVGLRSLAFTNGNAHETELPEEESDSQLTFEGFIDGSEKVPVVDEAEIEEELSKKRREKAAEFVLSREISEASEEANGKYGIDEYRSVNDKLKVSLFIKKKKTAALFGTVAGASAVAVLFVLSAISESEKNATPFLALNLAFSVFGALVCKNVFFDGIKSVFKLKFNRNSGAAISVAVSVICGVLLLFADSPFENGIRLYSASALLPLVLCSAAELSEYSRIMKNFAAISESELYSVGNIDDSDTAFEIGKGLLVDEPKILSSQKTRFPAGFLEMSLKYYPADDINKRTVPIILGASLITAVITFVVTKNIFAALSAFSALLGVGVPYFSYFADALSIGSASKKLSTDGVISGWESWRECSEANAVAVDASDIFDNLGGNIHRIRTFHSMTAYEAILDAAALAVPSGGPLGALFERVVLGKTELIPTADTIVYEDRLGLSAWLRNRRVLVGSEDLLRNHNVELPERSTYAHLIHEGMYPLFLAVEGKIAAMFIISYGINEKNAEALRDAERRGLTLLVRSTDANITDEMLSSLTGVPVSGIKVLSAVSSDVLSTYKNETRSAAKASLMHSEKDGSFLKCISTALSLDTARHTTGLVQAGASGIGVAIVAALGITSGVTALSCSQLIITQLLFTIAGTVFARRK